MDISTTPAMGTHLLVDHFGGEALDNAARIETALRRAAKAAGATVLMCNLHKFGGHGGVTGVLLLAESHISIHTWPEKGYAAIDIFMCGSARPDKAAAALKQDLRPDRVAVTRVSRGSTEPIIPPV